MTDQRAKPDKPAVEGGGVRSERDEPIKIDLDPEVALRALLKVQPPETEQQGGAKRR